MRKFIIFLAVLFLLILLFFYSIIRLRPVAFVKAEATAKNITLRVIADSVAEVSKEEKIDYNSLVELGRDSDGNVTSLSSKAENINIFKSLLSKKILEKLEASESKEFAIPIGNLTGSLVFTGRGPAIKVKIIETSFLKSEIKSEFSECGINQTRHTINADIRIKMKIVMLTKAYDIEVFDRVVIADTVIVGKVPDGYTAINKADNELIGDIVDFKAE